jgi:predicted ATP-grasp superfamily ATP-dependent carboligase
MKEHPVTSFDIRVPAVLMRLDPNPFHHGTLGAVRSLGRAGVEVHAVVESAHSPVARSRYVGAVHVRSCGAGDLAGIHRTLRAVAERVGRPAVLVPLDDATAIAAARLREDLGDRYLMPETPSGLVERVADKAELVALCAEHGVPHPRTAVPGTAREAGAAAEALGLPAVAKWSRPWLLPGGTGLRSTRIVRSARDARELFAWRAEAGCDLLIQEYLPPGEGLDWFFHGYAGSHASGRVGAAGRKERSWPVGAGLTAVGTWRPNAEVERIARRLVAALGYRGILDLDFRLDPGTGAYHLLDFNPRPGAQFRLFTDRAGTDVVRALHLDLTGRRVPEAPPAHGRRFVVENYALLSVLAGAGTRVAGRAARGPGGGGTGRHAGSETAWWAADDPLPAAAMALAWSLHAARRARLRLGAATARTGEGVRSGPRGAGTEGAAAGGAQDGPSGRPRPAVRTAGGGEAVADRALPVTTPGPRRGGERAASLPPGADAARGPGHTPSVS